MRGEREINSEFNQAQLATKESQKVDINVLLNKVRAANKKEKIENTIFFSLVAMVIVVTGIIVSL